MKKTNKICLVCLVPDDFDNSIFETPFLNLNVQVEIVRLPFFFLSALTLSRLNVIRGVLSEKSKDCFVVFVPNTIELFFPEADWTIAFSAYRSWFDPKRMTVIPHLWTPVGLPDDFGDLMWSDKPALRVGFMGRSHATSRLARLILSAPDRVKQHLLQGRHLQNVFVIAWLCEIGFSLQNINAFPRIEAMNVLRGKRAAHPEVALEIVERQEFGGTENELDAYKRHLRSNTYVICARGSENYSFRLYETLNFGRIPVIVDTDMVLPKEIDWERLSIIVPYSSLDRIYDAIVQDYETRSAEDFLSRQRDAFTTMKGLQSMNWMKETVGEIVKCAAQAR